MDTKRFCHGFLTLSDKAYFEYKCTDFYKKDDENTIHWKDPDLNIPWPSGINIIVSEKDENGKSLKSIQTLNKNGKILLTGGTGFIGSNLLNKIGFLQSCLITRKKTVAKKFYKKYNFINFNNYEQLNQKLKKLKLIQLFIVQHTM